VNREKPSLTKIFAIAVVLLTMLNGMAFAWEWTGQGKAREQRRAEAEEAQQKWDMAEAVCGPHPELRADADAMMRQIDADINELQNAKDSRVVIRQIERHKVREARDDRLKAEWEHCAQSV
jgi:Tfp pilus assembly protein PilO